MTSTKVSAAVPPPEGHPPFLAGGGHTGAALRALDWTRTPLGPPEGWPAPLKTLVGVALKSEQPMLIVWGPEHTTLYNDGYAAMCGQRHPAALGRPFDELWADIWDQVEPILARAYAGEAIHMEDVAFTMHRNGYPEETWFAFGYTPVHDETGRVAGMFCACTETTARVRAEREARAAGERMRDLFEQSPGFMAVLRGPDHVFELANASYRKLVGGREMVGRTMREALPEVEAQGFLAQLDQVYATGQAHVGRGVAVTLEQPDGTVQECRVDFVLQPIAGPDGHVSGIFIEGADVTEAHRAAEALRTREATLSAILDALPVGVIIADANGAILRDNAANREIWGIPPETRDWSQYGDWVGYWPETGARIQAHEWGMARALLKGEVVRGELVECQRFGTGERRLYLNSAAPVRDASGAIIGGVVAELDVTERLAAERALAAKEAQLRTILDTVPVGIVLAELPSGRVVEGNGYVERMLRHPILPSPDIDSYDEWVSYHADGTRVSGHEYPLARMVREGEEAPEIEVQYQRGDGTRAWTRIMGRTVRDAGGELVGGVVALVDIDAERRAREEAQRLADEFRTLADNISQFAWTADETGAITWYNKRWYDYTGTTIEEMRGWGWRAVHHPDHVDRVVRSISHAFATGTLWEDTFPLRGADGQYRWFLSRAVPIRDDDGRIVRWFGTNTDIDELTRTQNEVERASALLRLIGDSTPDMIYAKDRDSRILYGNASLTRVLGLPMDQIIGRSDRDWAPDAAQAEAIVQNDRRVMESGGAVDVDEAFTGPDGRTRYYRSVKAPLRDATGAIIGLVGVTSDITARREAEEREKLLAREVDHRAKNMLAVVQSLVQLTRAEDVAALKEAVSGRIQALARAHSLLAASRWEGVDIGKLAREELAPFAGRDASRVTISGPMMRLRPEAAQTLALALHELATNAAKYGALSVQGGRLDVAWGVDGAMLDLRWRERGGPPVAPPTRRGFGSTLIGTGVEHQLQGRVVMDWRREGLECQLSFPVELLAEAPETRPAPATGAADPSGDAARSPEGLRVLVLEDEALIALQLVETLRRAGCEVVGPVATIAQAADHLRGRAVDAAILDVNLAGERSFPVADILMAKRVPFAFCTGYAGATDLPERFGGVPTIAKPFAEKELSALLRRFTATCRPGERP
ncbi:MAG TPA: PAS domain-containing protein [Azospirillaceae bacterium]|nr:PAS domain-containing protein [Azospirillaceae bacterium]